LDERQVAVDLRRADGESGTDRGSELLDPSCPSMMTFRSFRERHPLFRAVLTVSVSIWSKVHYADSAAIDPLQRT